jgi:hypothetical protein
MKTTMIPIKTLAFLLRLRPNYCNWFSLPRLKRGAGDGDPEDSYL